MRLGDFDSLANVTFTNTGNTTFIGNSVTKFQKAMFLVGVIRSGKGTICRILEKIVGIHNTTTQSTADFAQNFGFESFIGKTLAVVPDARFDRKNMVHVLEKILNITGEDSVKINRKNKQALSLRLPTKLMLFSNDVPNIIDQSGALASRFIFIKLTKSFYGKEDLDLEAKLSNELSGILNLAIQHLKKLLERGQFIQPVSGRELSQRMTALSSPVGEFVKYIPPSPYATRNVIWNYWTKYCEGNKLRTGRQEELWNNLESVGYTCDFDAANILAKIRRDGSSTARELRECSKKLHDAEVRDAKLDEMVKSGLLMKKIEIAANNLPIEVYSMKSPQFQVDEIPASPLTLENTEKYADGGDWDGIIGS